ncbi:MAG: SpoIIE family protein phosphatase [Planctomycetes bacterium]|nr:SpoIIE family protein phosphatase [Planctomycetota bacterium]
MARRLPQVAEPVKATAPASSGLPWYQTIRFQFSAFTGGLITVLIAVLGTATYWQSSRSLNEQIEKNGVRLVREVTRLGERFLKELSSDIPRPYDEIHAQYQKEMMERFGKTAEDVVDAAIKGDDKTVDDRWRTITATGEPYSFTEGHARQSRYDPHIFLWASTMVLQKTKQRISIRVFKRHIPESDDIRAGGNVYITLSAAKIDRALWGLFFRLVAMFLIATAIGIVTAYVLANRFTAPISMLVEDFEIVSKGNLEHRTEAHSSNEIGYLAQHFDDLTVRLRALQRAEIAYKAREHELKVAEAIQQSLLPKDVPQIAGYDIHAFYRSSFEVGGDYYDFIRIDEDQLGIVVADVSGKGIPASMVMAMARSVMRAAAHGHQSAADVLKEVNHIMAEDLRRGTFVTALYMLLRHKDKELYVSSAGHNPFVLYSSSTNKCRLIRPRGIALGFDKGPIFNNTIEEEVIKISPGDRIVAYTDGVVEARSPDGDQFGDERLMNLVASADGMSSEAFVQMLVGEVTNHEGPGQQHDDITIATFHVL